MTLTNVLTNPTERQLAYAVEENLFALFQAMAATLPDAEMVRTEKLNYHLAFPTNPMFKGIWRTRLSSDEVNQAIDKALAWFKERGAPYVFWWTGPGTRPDDLGARLQAHGLIDMAEQMQELAGGIKQTALGAPGMVADLHHMNEAALNTVPSEFSIKEVASEADLYDFKRVFIESYEIADQFGQAWVDATLSLGIGKTPWRMYVGRLDGKPVATNMLFNGAGVASVYAVATAPPARGKGIGGAITLKPLLEARDMGYRYAVLFSSEMGVRVYERIGFRLANVRINRYLWRAR
ncbi:MAG: GNAT family N-acetyltransferase [Anaerolineae bacterium]|nr:GNAT family N-acetyltransferase [Anaerolineae bacterium]